LYILCIYASGDFFFPLSIIVHVFWISFDDQCIHHDAWIITTLLSKLNTDITRLYFPLIHFCSYIPVLTWAILCCNTDTCLWRSRAYCPKVKRWKRYKDWGSRKVLYSRWLSDLSVMGVVTLYLMSLYCVWCHFSFMEIYKLSQMSQSSMSQGLEEQDLVTRLRLRRTSTTLLLKLDLYLTSPRCFLHLCFLHLCFLHLCTTYVWIKFLCYITLWLST